MADVANVATATGEAGASLMFRGPSTSAAIAETSFVPPSIGFLQGTWHVTHSTLPMWKSNRNITITYNALETSPGDIDDLVRYQPIGSDKVKTVHGTDHPDPNVEAKYKWRGRGWLMIASSEWEVLGYGNDEGGWAVTYFAKTLFTPAGIDIYARGKVGLSANFVDKIKVEMEKIGDVSFRNLVNQMFPIQHDQDSEREVW